MHFRHKWETVLVEYGCVHWKDLDKFEDHIRHYNNKRRQKWHYYPVWSGHKACLRTLYQSCTVCGKRSKKEESQRTPRPRHTDPWLDNGELPK